MRAETLNQSSIKEKWLADAFLILGCSMLIGLFSKVSIPLPFTPVPLAIQGHLVLFIAVLLGSKRAVLCVLAFIAQGAFGLPVFAGGKFGLLHLAGPTGGYLLGYVVSAYVAGWIRDRRSRSSGRDLFALSMGNLVIFAFGLPWLSVYLGMQKAFLLGMLPFLPGDVLKLLFFTNLLKTFRQQV